MKYVIVRFHFLRLKLLANLIAFNKESMLLEHPFKPKAEIERLFSCVLTYTFPMQWH